MLEKLCPIMPSGDIARSEAFYSSLGFFTVYKEIDQYLLMKRDDAEVHFFFKETHQPKDSEHGAYLRPSDVNAFSEEVEELGLPADKGWPRFWPAEDKDWGMREAVIWDPDGNLIRAGQEIPDWKNAS